MSFNYEDGSFIEEETKALNAAKAAVEYGMKTNVPLDTFNILMDTATALNVFVLNSRYERLVRERNEKKNIIRRLLRK